MTLTPEQIAAIFFGTALLVREVFAQLRTSRDLKTTAALAVVGDDKLNKLATKAEETRQLVDGPVTQLLERVAKLEEREAARTGSPLAGAIAAQARLVADAHAAHSEGVIASTDAATAAQEAHTAALEDRKKRRP